MAQSIDELYNAWKRQLLPQFQTARIICPRCEREMEGGPTCPSCGTLWSKPIGVVEQSALILNTMIFSITGFVLLVAAIAVTVALRIKIGLGPLTTVFVVVVGVPFLIRGLRNEWAEVARALQERANNSEATLKPRDYFMLAWKLQKKAKPFWPSAARCYAEAMARGGITYSGTWFFDLFAFWKRVKDVDGAFSAEFGKALHMLTCAETIFCYLYTSMPIAANDYNAKGRLFEVTKDCPATSQMCQLVVEHLGVDTFRSQRRAMEVVRILEKTDPFAARILNPE